MKCNEILELMPDLATGASAATPEVQTHLETCKGCEAKLGEFQKTMALLDEWQAPEPSPYFDTRMQARLREEAAKQPVGWLHWIRRPALAGALALVAVVGVSVLQRGDLRFGGGTQPQGPVAVVPGTAVGDLQALDKNDDLYSNFDVLDDLAVQQDVSANP